MKETEIISIPPLFICPISLDLFKDPVTLCTGQTYDRSSIEKWLAAGNVTCPVTMQKLDDVSLVPNHTLRHLIDQWLQESSSKCREVRSDYTEEDIDYEDDGSITELKHSLISPEFRLEEKLQLLERIFILASELPWQKSLLLKSDFFAILVEQVFRYSNASYSEVRMRFTEKALTCSFKLLPYSNMMPLNLLKEEPLLENLITLFRIGSLKIKRYLCNLVEVISIAVETQELCGILGISDKFLQEIMHLLQPETEASEAGIKAISALSLLESNRVALVRKAAVEGLIEYIIKSDKHRMRSATTALETIERLLVVENAKAVVLNHPKGIKTLVKMVFRVSDHQGSESAVNSLIVLCSDSVYAREEAICAGVMTQLLLLLQSQCNAGTKSRARMLLKLLKSMWAEGSKQTI